jgi:hypothetical protein
MIAVKSETDRPVHAHGHIVPSFFFNSEKFVQGRVTQQVFVNTGMQGNTQASERSG